MRWIAVILLAAAGFAAPPQSKKKAVPPRRAPVTETRRDWPIRSLGVTGNREFPAAKILQVADLKVGQTASKEVFEAARERLLATGFFASVGYRYEPSADGKGYAATFEVVEVEPLYAFRFEDLPAPAPDLRAALERADPLFGPKIPATEPVLKRYAKAIESHLASAGKKEAVAGRLIADGPDRLVVLFRPAAAPPVIAYVKFAGCAVLPVSTLQNAMAGVAVGVPYSEARVRQLLDSAIRPIYEGRGRLRVAFPKIAAAPAPDVKGLVVTVVVEEGASYNLGEVRVEGAPASPESLLKAANLKVDDIANFQDVEAGRQRMLKLLRRNGYMRADARVERRIDDTRKKVDITFQFTSGPQYLFGKLSIEGLDILSEPQVRKLWTMAEGKPFDGDYPDYFLSRVREDGVFDNLGPTRSAARVDDQQRTVDVTLVFGRAAPKPKRELDREQ